MRERAAAIGGKLSLKSVPRGGTSVEIVLRA
jgi:signal transduction histidine kinase